MQTATQPPFTAPSYRVFSGWVVADWALYLLLVLLYAVALLVGGLAPRFVQELPAYGLPLFVVVGVVLAFAPWVYSRSSTESALDVDQAGDGKLLALRQSLVLLRPCPSYHFVEDVLIQLSRPTDDPWASPTSLLSSPAFPVQVWVRDMDDMLIAHHEFTTGAVRLGSDWGPGFYTLQVVHPEFDRTLNVLKTGPATLSPSLGDGPWGAAGAHPEAGTGASLVSEPAELAA
jgi:hypothetical protein